MYWKILPEWPRLFGVDRDRMTVSWQTHTVNVRRMTKADGERVIIPRDYRDVDGMITDVPGQTLVTFMRTVCRCILWIGPIGPSA